MRRRVTRTDVAREAGVSPTTVSFVINNRLDMGISQETIARVTRAIKKLGYTRNRVAHALSTGKTETIALWTTLLHPAYYSYIAEHIESGLYEVGYDTMVADIWKVVRTQDEGLQEKHLARITSWAVDGVLAFDCPWYVKQYLKRSRRKGPPVVSFGADVVRTCDHVFLDIYPGARDAVELLVETGRKRIGYVCDEYGCVESEPRYRAYRDVLQAVGMEEDVIILSGRDRATAHSSFLQVAKERRVPEALFCYNDETALGVLRALGDVGLRVPSDVAIMGHDGLADVAYVEPRLSTVVLPTGQMCDAAIRFLLDRIADPDRDPQTHSLRGEVRKEASC